MYSAYCEIDALPHATHTTHIHNPHNHTIATHSDQHAPLGQIAVSSNRAHLITSLICPHPP